MRWIVFLVLGAGAYGLCLLLLWALCVAAARADEAARQADAERWQ